MKLEIGDTFPQNLRIFDVKTEKGSKSLHGSFRGKENEINEIKERLIHSIQANE